MNNSSRERCEQAHLMLCAHVAYAQYLNKSPKEPKKKISKEKQQTNKRDGTEVQAQEILLPSVFPPHKLYRGQKCSSVYIILNFLAFDKPARAATRVMMIMIVRDDDDDVGSPITSLLLKDQRKSHIKNAVFALFNFS